MLTAAGAAVLPWRGKALPFFDCVGFWCWLKFSSRFYLKLVTFFLLWYRFSFCGCITIAKNDVTIEYADGWKQ